MPRPALALLAASSLALGAAAGAAAQDASNAGNGGDGSLLVLTGDVAVGDVTGDGNDVSVEVGVGPLGVDASGGDDNVASNPDLDVDVNDRDTEIDDSAIIEDSRTDNTFLDAGETNIEEDFGRDRPRRRG